VAEGTAIVSELTVHTPGLLMVEREFRVPLDHSRPGAEQITVFAREVAEPEGGDPPIWSSSRVGRATRPLVRPATPPIPPGWTAP
jgi:hypothetical protein